MRATVIKEFRGKGDHDTTERYFAEGETIYGALAEQAIKDGNAEQDGATAVKKPAAKKK